MSSTRQPRQLDPLEAQDLQHITAVPTHFYRSKAIYQTERQSLFANGWSEVAQRSRIGSITAHWKAQTIGMTTAPPSTRSLIPTRWWVFCQIAYEIIACRRWVRSASSTNRAILSRLGYREKASANPRHPAAPWFRYCAHRSTRHSQTRRLHALRWLRAKDAGSDTARDWWHC